MPGGSCQAVVRVGEGACRGAGRDRRRRCDRSRREVVVSAKRLVYPGASDSFSGRGRGPQFGRLPATALQGILPARTARLVTMPFRYPCTGLVRADGFGAFLDRELGEPRANVRRFAAELAAAFGVGPVSLVNSGSSANLVAALAVAEDVGRGAHAIAAGFTFPTTLAALQLAGFRVTLVDVRPGDWVIDPAAVRRALRPDTRLLCITHFLGYPAPLGELRPLVEAGRLRVIQDACETMGLSARIRRACLSP
jgi:DegT/DnrJ/EryC1/StrS aminotransferase family